MDSVSICSRNDLFPLWEIVEDRFPNQSVVAEKKEGANWKIIVDIQYLNEFSKIFSRWLHHQIWRKVLGDIIVESFELTPTEKKNIFISVVDFMEENEEEFVEIIYQKAVIMLNNYKEMKLEGFTSFSIQEYRDKLEEVIEICFEQYLVEKEYREFINLLQYYIEVEGYQFGMLTVVADVDGKYTFFDEYFHNITNQCMQQFVTEFEKEIPEPDDCLITILILLLPEKVMLHGTNNIKNERILKTLKKLFGRRIEFFSETDISIKK